MNWEAVGAVGEVAAAITVLITLIYLSLQVRSVKEQTASAAHQYEFNGLNQFAITVAESESLCQVMVKGRNSYASLSETERLRFDHIHSYFFNLVESMYLLNGEASHMLDEPDSLENIKANVKLYCDNPGVREFWSQYQRFYPDPIKNLVAEAIAVE